MGGSVHRFANSTAVASFDKCCCLQMERKCRHYGLQKWKQPVSIGWKYAVAGALFGTLSHLLLDSLMHADMSPFFPFTKINPLLGLMQHDAVYKAMVVFGIAGALIWWLRQLKMK